MHEGQTTHNIHEAYVPLRVRWLLGKKLLEILLDIHIFRLNIVVVAISIQVNIKDVNESRNARVSKKILVLLFLEREIHVRTRRNCMTSHGRHDNFRRIVGVVAILVAKT